LHNEFFKSYPKSQRRYVMSDEIKRLKAEREALKAQIGLLLQVREQEQLRATQEECRQATARLRELKRVRPEKMGALQEELHQVEENLREAREILKKVQGEYVVTEGRLFSQGWSIDEEIRGIETFLRRTAPVHLKSAPERAELKVEKSRSRPIERVSEPDLPGAETNDGDQEHKPACPSCTAALLQECADVEWEVKEES
jgi:hypothetical protein